MKKSMMLKTSLREIWQTKTRFLSIFGIIFLGVAFFVGIGATGPDMLQTATNYYQQQNLADNQIISSLGLTEDDLKIVQADENVASAEAFKFADINLTSQTAVVRFYGYTPEQKINQYSIVSGRVPEKADEIALDNREALSGNYQIGDSYEVSEDDDVDGLLANYAYTVVGFVNSPTYVENVSRGYTNVGTGSVDYFAVVLEENLTADVYSTIYVTYQNLADLPAYSTAYEDALATNQTQLEQELTERPAERLSEIKAEAQEQIDEASQEVADGEQALADAQTTLEDSAAQLADGQSQLEAARQELTTQTASAQAEIDQSEAQLNASQTELDNNRQTLASRKNELTANAGQVEAAKNSLTDLEQQRSQAQAGLDQITTAQQSLESLFNQLSLASQTSDEEYATLAPQLAQGVAASLGQLPAEVAGVLQNFVADPSRENLQISIGALSEYQNQLTAQAQEIQNGLNQIDAGIAEINGQVQQYNDGLAQIQSAETQLANGQSQIDSGRQQLQAAKDQLATATAEGQGQIDASQQELDQAQAAYDDGLAEYQSQLAEKEPELADAKNKIAEQQSELDQLTASDYTYSTRNDNPGYSEFEDNANRISSLATVFPIIFFLIAALVSLTTMTRMVEEKRSEIGTFKALGYGNSAISMKFIIYASLAGITGAFAGLALGFYLFPVIIFTAYGQLYNIGNFVSPWHLNYAVIAIIVAILCTVGTALLVLRIDLLATPASLMRPKAPKAGKRIFLERLTPIWKRLSFIQKVTMRNLFRYKQRMLMTILGIAGCMSMIITGFGLRDSISDIVTIQFDKIWHYSAVVTFNEEPDEEQTTDYEAILADVADFSGDMFFSNQTLQLEKSGKTTRDVTVYVPENPERMSDFVLFNDRKTGEEYTLDDSGAIINEKLAEMYDLQVGDSFPLTDSDGGEYQVKIAHIAENYTGHFAYLTPDYYQEVFNQSPDYNSDLLLFSKDLSTDEENQAANQIMADSQVVNISFISQSRDALGDTINSLNIVVWVLIISAGLLAFIVLYNLTNINVSERIRELSTIKVLGFYDKEVTMYVYRENIILTFIGIFFGLFLGNIEHAYVLKTVEVDMIMFSPDIHLLSYLYASLITLLFTLIVGLFMHQKLKKVDMIEALKSNE
ncbi:FtsX-like permease family protein [Enterococcus sp. LJL120]